MNGPIKWAAQLEHVREVTLLGSADFSFWCEKLRKEELVPAQIDGKARVMIISAEGRFMGIRFRELSFSVVVAESKNGDVPEGAFLIRAFNSFRFFAFCERTFFSTPYYFGDVRVLAAVPFQMHLGQRGEVLFRAEMRASVPGEERQPTRSGNEGWEGPIFLPTHGGAKSHSLFFGRLRGETQTYPFLPGHDDVTIRPSVGNEILQALLDSQFVPLEWSVRPDASHAKSKTYQRKELFPVASQGESG